MICPTCHSKNPEGSLFCTNCGSSLAHADACPEPSAPSAVCPACGAAVEEGFAFCPSCGAPLVDGAPSESVPHADAAPSSEIDDATTASFAGSVASLASTEPGDGATTRLAGDELAAGALTADAALFCETRSATEGAASVDSPADFCPFCGAPVQPDEAFCSFCGARIGLLSAHPEKPGAAAAASVAPARLDATVPDMARVSAFGSAAAGVAPYAPAQTQAPSTKRVGTGTGKVVAIVVAVLAVLVLIGGGIGWYLHDQSEQQAAAQQAAEETAHAPRTVAIAVAAKGWDTEAGASRLAVHIVGEDLDGDAVDEVQYVTSAGAGIELRQGTYQFSLSGSPIAADGTIYTVPLDSVAVTIESEDADDEVDVSGSAAFTLTPVDALEVTDEQIEKAYQLAVADKGEGAPDAESLKSAAIARRDEAIAAKEAAEAEAAEESAREARHVVAASYELYLPAYWDGRVTVEVDGNDVIIRSKAYPRLEVCTIQVQRGATRSWGDYLTNCKGDVSLGEGHYASVWATNWGLKIAELYALNSSDPSTYYSLEEASEIVDLQTGGAITYTKVRDDYLDSNDAHSQLVDEYLRANVVNAISPL